MELAAGGERVAIGVRVVTVLDGGFVVYICAGGPEAPAALGMRIGRREWVFKGVDMHMREIEKRVRVHSHKKAVRACVKWVERWIRDELSERLRLMDWN